MPKHRLGAALLFACIALLLTRGAFSAAQQGAHVGELAEDSERAVDRGRIIPRLEIQTDRGSADNEEDGEANSKNDTLRRHCQLLISLF